MALKIPTPSGRRSDSAKIRKEQQAIIKDMESRLPPDSEDPESVQRRRNRFSAPPSKRGALVTGTRKNNPPV